MTRQEIQDQLRPLRRELVLAAEKVVMQPGRSMPERAQFSHLVGVCGEASCSEEIDNYIRYQAGRKVWPPEFARAAVDGVQPVLKKLQDDALRVEAWRLYAVFLTRAHRYASSAQERGR